MLSRLLFLSLLVLSFAAPALADTTAKPDDTVSYNLSAEDWVTTKTAHVVLGVEAAVSASNAGALRADMTKAINDAAKADWRLTGFNRIQDQTGMERWSVMFDARLSETSLNGLADAVKKASKAGMQIAIESIDFTPTLDETEAARTELRTRLLKEAGEQLAALNGTLPGRGYRIAQINFEPENVPVPMPGRMMAKPMVMSAMASSAPDSGQSEEHAQKLRLNAQVVFAALPSVPTSAH
jgi:predicted secreted protein